MPAVGIDTAKNKIDVAYRGSVRTIARNESSVMQVLDALPRPCQIVIEPTSRYHRMVVEVARGCGHEVRLVETCKFSKYKDSLDLRCSNDKKVALALERYAEKEWDAIPARVPAPKAMEQLRDLISLRESQLRLKIAFESAQSEFGKAPAKSNLALKAMEASIADLDKKITRIASKNPLYKVLLNMDGVGPVSAPVLVWLFEAHDFKDVDELIAFVGLDVRIRESGKFKGHRKLSKRGWPVIRKYGYCMANAMRSIDDLKPLFEKYDKRGMRAKATNMIVFRKLLRAAFAIAKHGEQYDRATFLKPRKTS